MYGFFVCVCMCACVCACVHACMWVPSNFGIWATIWVLETYFQYGMIEQNSRHVNGMLM